MISTISTQKVMLRKMEWCDPELMSRTNVCLTNSRIDHGILDFYFFRIVHCHQTLNTLNQSEYNFESFIIDYYLLLLFINQSALNNFFKTWTKLNTEYEAKKLGILFSRIVCLCEFCCCVEWIENSMHNVTFSFYVHHVSSFLHRLLAFLLLFSLFFFEFICGRPFACLGKPALPCMLYVLLNFPKPQSDKPQKESSPHKEPQVESRISKQFVENTKQEKRQKCPSSMSRHFSIFIHDFLSFLLRAI